MNNFTFSNTESVSNTNTSSLSYSNGLEEPMTPATKLSRQLEFAFFISTSPIRKQNTSNFEVNLKDETIPNSINTPPSLTLPNSVFERTSSVKTEFEREYTKLKVRSVASPCSNELRPVFEHTPTESPRVSTVDQNDKTAIIKTILNSAIAKRDSKLKKQKKMGGLNRRWHISANQLPIFSEKHTADLV